MMAGAGTYTSYIYKTRRESKKDDFVRMIESMKQISENHLDGEKGYVIDWAEYISSNNMTLEEALDFLRTINADKNRYAHIVDMDTYEAYSSYFPKGEENIDTYIKYLDNNDETEKQFGEIMQNMFNGTDGTLNILGKYRIDETKSMGIGIGGRITLSTNEGRKDYLLLRIIPVDDLKKSWVFPTEYADAEIGIITRSGDYVVQSSSMKSLNFNEYIRAYNFQDDYNRVNDLKMQLETTDNGILEYKNFRGTDCFWYYSSFGEDSVLDILGVINVDSLKVTVDAWYIIVLVFSTLLILIMGDGVYLTILNHRLEEEVIKSERASKAKTLFLSAMSHDIRTPLNAVMGVMELTRKNSDNPQYVVDYMDKGLHSGKQLLTLINDVLDISRIESGNLTLNPEQLSLETLMTDLMDLLSNEVLKKGISLECSYDELPFKYVYADRMRLNQIYMNLLTNSIKYTEPGGKVKVHLYEEAVPDNSDNTRLVFSVDDNGIGMTEEFQKNMYNMFAREINTQVNSIQGTGLGLSIVKQMTDLMGGTIECKSVHGKGTIFTVSIELPVVKEYEQEKIIDGEEQDISGMRLLVAEDNDLNWEIFREMVADRDIICDHAENGKKCIDMLIKSKPGTYSAILMDIHMPVMNGYEATKVIRSLNMPEYDNIPIIAMTADAFAEDVRACLDCGMNRHIAKPVSMNELISCLVKVKNGQL